MYFKQYSDNSATLKEWSRQLNVSNKGNYPLYPTIEQTLIHWKSILNANIGANTFNTYQTAEATISDWQNKLNQIYNQ